MTSAGEGVYVFGGCGNGDRGRLNDLHKYDPAANTWAQLPTAGSIVGRGGSCLSVSPSGKELLVIGGFAGRELSDMHKLDLESNQWECPSCCSQPSGLSARSVFGTAIHTCPASPCGHGGHILAFGGEVDPSEIGHAGEPSPRATKDISMSNTKNTP